MAFSLEQIRNTIIVSLHGRRLGLDAGNGYLLGIGDFKRPIEDLTTTPTTLVAYGLSRVTATGSTQGPVQYFLPAPVPGVIKRISITTTSTASFQFLSTANGASILAASDATTKSLVNLVGQGGSVTLFAVTTAIWQVIGYTSTGGVTYTTST